MTGSTTFDPAGALERAQADPEFEDALRAAYQGRHDVLDALWWAAHPLTTSPRGVSDPALAVKDLQRAAFSRAATNSPTVEVVDEATGTVVRMREAEHRLHQEQRLLSEDAQHLSEAMTAAHAASQQQSTRRDETSPSEFPEPGRAPRKLLVPVVSGVALLAAIMLLPSVAQLDADAERAPTAPAPTAERVQTEIVTLESAGTTADPLAILDRPQTDADIPTGDIALNHERDTYRALPGLVAHAEIYLARQSSPAYVCLVVVLRDSSMSGCTSESLFAENGVNVGGGARYQLSDTVTILTERFTLLADGAFHYDATARVTGLDDSPAAVAGIPIHTQR